VKPNSMKNYLLIILLSIATITSIQAQDKELNEMYNKAAEKAAAGDYTGALADYNYIVSVNPSFPKIYFQRGFLKFMMRDFKGAIDDFDQALKKDTPDEEVYLYRGLCNFELKEYQSAVDDYSKALLIDEEFEMAYLYRGETYIQLNKREEGCRDISIALQMGLEKAKEASDKYCK
jgi:tetratricopeptide (TPR) repeat protein